MEQTYDAADNGAAADDFISMSDDVSQLTDRVRAAIRKEKEVKRPAKAGSNQSNALVPVHSPWVTVKALSHEKNRVVYECDDKMYGRSFTVDTMTGEISLGPETPAAVEYRLLTDAKNKKSSKPKEVMGGEKDEDDDDAY